MSIIIDGQSLRNHINFLRRQTALLNKKIENLSPASGGGSGGIMPAPSSQGANISIANLPVKDEDNMASNSDIHLVTQQSVKQFALPLAGGVMTGPLTVGVDDTGHDVKFFGATSGQYMLWDESTDKLIVTGEIKAGSLDISGDVDVDGTLETDALTINGTATGALALLDTVGTSQIDDDAVTYAKVQNVAANNVLLGNDDGAGSAIQELSKSDVLALLNVADGAQVNVATNLSKTTATDQITITSSTGTDVVIGEATDAIAGLMSTTHHDKLDGIAASANNYVHPTHDGDDIDIDTTALTGATVISDLDFNITTDTLGHVTDANGTVATRNLTLGNLGYTGDTDANNYSLPIATGSALGGIKVGSNLTIDSSTGVLNAGPIALTTVQTAANQAAQLALTVQEGDVVVRTDQNKSYIRNSGTAGDMTDFQELLTPTDAVLSVTTTDGTYINLTPNTATTGAINVTADLSAVNGTADTTTRFLSKDNTWDVPDYTDNTFRTIKVDTTNDGTANETIGATEELKLIGGTAISLTESAGVVTINGVAETYTAHDNISAASSVDNSGRTYIQDITLDSNGHVTGIASATETVVNTNTDTLQTIAAATDDDDKFVTFVETATGAQTGQSQASFKFNPSSGTLKTTKMQLGAAAAGTLNENTGVKLAIIGDGGDNNDGLIIARDNGSQNQLDQFINIYHDGNANFVTSGGTSVHGHFVFMSTNDAGANFVDRFAIDSSGTSTFHGDVVPSTDSAHELGTNTVRWLRIYADNVHTSYLGAGSVNTNSVETLNLTINGAQGSDGQVLTSTGSGVGWEDATGTVDGSGTANDVVMWSDSDTLTDAPIAISGNDASFAGNIALGGGTLKTYHSNVTSVIALDDNGSIFTRADETYIGHNIYYDSGDDGTAIEAGYSTLLRLTEGEFYIYGTAASVSADATTSIQERFKIDTSGDATFAGELYVPNKLIHVGDTDTWIQFETDVISLRTGGTDRLTLTNTSATFDGNVSVNGAGQKAVLHVKNEANNWEDGVLLEHDSGDTGWNIHPENNSDNALWFGYNSDTSVALTSQAATAALKLNSDLSATFLGVINANGGINVTGNIDTPELSINDYIKHNGDTNTYFGFPGADTYKVVTTGQDALTIDSNQGAKFEALVYIEDGTNPDGSGTSSGVNSGGTLTVEGRRDGTANLLCLRARDNTGSTLALPADQGGLIRWQGFDGTDFSNMGAIAVNADGQAVANGDSPSKMIFYTVPDDSDTPTTALTLDKSQNATFAGQINAIGGNAGTPSYIFEGDTNTGFFHPATDAIAFSTAGSERMRITASGAVQQQSDDATPLQVTGIQNGGTQVIMRQSRGTIASPSNSSTNGDGNYLTSQVYNSGYTSIGNIGIITGGNLNEGAIQFQTADGGTVAEKMRLDNKGDLTIIASYSGGTDPFRVGHGTYASFTPTFTINDNGYVGIGTDPDCGLEVYGANNTAAKIKITNTNATDNEWSIYANYNTQDLIFLADSAEVLRLGDGPSATFAGYVVTDGQVGVDTYSPYTGTMLHASGASTSPDTSATNPADTTAFFTNSDIAYGTLFATHGSGIGEIMQRRTNAATYYDLHLQPHGGEDAGLGIGGSVDAGFKFQVNGNSKFSGANTVADFTSSSTYSDIIFRNSAGVGGFVNFNSTTSFNVYVGGGSGSDHKLSLTNAGLLTVTGDVVAYGSPSDISLKENIKPIDNALDKVSKLKGVTFDWKKSDSILKIKEDIGFIAQDVKEVLPDLVRTNDDGKLSLRDKGIIPVLVEAIKELEARVKELENK